MNSSSIATENGSNNRSESYKDKAKNEIIKHFSDSSMGDKCYVSLLQIYLRRLPPKVKEKESADFYWKLKDQDSGKQRCLLVYYASMRQEFPCISCQERV